MKFGTCQKCGAKLIPIDNGLLVQHMGSKRPCDWGIPSDVRQGIDIPFVNNPHLSLFQNMTKMLNLIERA